MNNNNEKQDATRLSDKELVDGMLANDERIIHYFLFKACAPMFGYIAKSVFEYKADKDELINELYLFLRENDWEKLRKFQYCSKLTTWLSVVAIRFFQKKRDVLIENSSSAALHMLDGYDTQDSAILKIDMESIISKIPNTRYREVIYFLFIEDVEPQQLADKMGITVENLYNVKRRALQQLIALIKRIMLIEKNVRKDVNKSIII